MYFFCSLNIFWGGVKKKTENKIVVNVSLHIELLQNIGFRKIPDL